MTPDLPTERSRQDWERLTPEQREAVRRIAASHKAPEYQEHARKAAELENENAPRAVPKADVLALCAALKAERERQGLSLAEVSVRSGIERGFVSKLENGKVANPTVATLHAFAGALGMKLVLGLEPHAEDRRG